MMNKNLYAMEKWCEGEHVWYCAVDNKMHFFCLYQCGFFPLGWEYADPGSSSEEFTITEEALADGGFVITVEHSSLYVEELGTVDKYYFNMYGGLVNQEHVDVQPDWDDCPEAWQDDSDRGCSDCPDDECTGHCMSCYYRPY